MVREHRFPKGNLIFSQMICRTSVRGRNTVRHASRLQVVSAYPQKHLPSACHVLKLPLHTKPKRKGQCFVFCSKQVLCPLPPRISLCSILRKFDFKKLGPGSAWSKIIRWIIFEVALYLQSVFENLFSCKKVLELSQ